MISMGKKITLYLTDAEYEKMKMICDHDHVPLNQARTLKRALVAMFDNCFSGLGHVDGAGKPAAHGDFVMTEQSFIENSPEEKFAEEGTKRLKCPKCGRIKVIPDEETMAKWTDDKLKDHGLRKWRCPECGKFHLAGINEIVITESPEDKKKREEKQRMEKDLQEKKAKARAEADKMMKTILPGLFTGRE